MENICRAWNSRSAKSSAYWSCHSFELSAAEDYEKSPEVLQTSETRTTESRSMCSDCRLQSGRTEVYRLFTLPTHVRELVL